MRRLIYNLLTAVPNEPGSYKMLWLPGGLFGDRAEFETPVDKPFGVLTHEGPLPGVSRHQQARFSLWVHDEPGDYTRIDNALKVLRPLVVGSTPRTLNGVWLTEAQWTSTSGDLFDAERRTNVKYSTFLLTGSGM